MADSPDIPGSHAPPLTGDGRWRDEWWRFLRDLAAQPEITSDQSAKINALAERVAALEDGGTNATIQGLLSVLVTGQLSDGLVQLSLAGDEAAPGPDRYYGTDATGAKGYHTLPDASIFNRITAEGDIRVTADGDLRITD